LFFTFLKFYTCIEMVKSKNNLSKQTFEIQKLISHIKKVIYYIKSEIYIMLKFDLIENTAYFLTVKINIFEIHKEKIFSF
jgi:hypothetical protein